MTVARHIRPRRRQLKPFESPEFRFELLGGGVGFGESDMVVLEVPTGKNHAIRVAWFSRPVGAWGRIPYKSEKQTPFSRPV
jgi:hypothetical protein